MRYDLSSLQGTRMGRSDRWQRMLGLGILLAFLAFGGSLIYRAITGAPTYDARQWVFFGVVLGFVAFFLFIGTSVFLLARGADEIEIDDGGLTVFLRGRTLWSRGWSDRRLLMQLTAQIAPTVGASEGPPVIYLNERGLRRCNLTRAAYDAILVEARTHALGVASERRGTSNYLQTVIRGQGSPVLAGQG